MYCTVLCVLSVAGGDSVAALQLSTSDMRRLARLARLGPARQVSSGDQEPGEAAAGGQVQVLTPPRPGDGQVQVAGAVAGAGALAGAVAATRSEPALHRQVCRYVDIYIYNIYLGGYLYLYLHRQGSLMSQLGSSVRRKVSVAQVLSIIDYLYLYLHDACLLQEMARGREEGRAARLYTVSLLLLAATWSPLYTLATVQVSTLDISTYLHIYISRYLHLSSCRRSPSRRPTSPRTCRRW